MLEDLRQRPDLGGLPGPASVAVVGAGAAGLALALALGDAGRDVVLLESGGEPAERIDDALADLNAGHSDGLAYTGLEDGRARVLGGATHLWMGQCMRLHPVDLEQRAWVPHSGWPFGLDELDPAYREAERWAGVTGSGYGADRWAEHPGLRPLAWDPSRLEHDFTEYTPDPLLARVHRRRLVAHPRVRVLLHATVSRVVVEEGSVAGVEVVRGGDRRELLAARTVVLAAGAVENARLLQLSDPAGTGLGTGAAHTGRYLQDHPVVRTAEVLPVDFRTLQDRYVALHRGRRRLFPKVRLAPHAQREHGLLDATAVFVHEHDDARLDAARRVLTAVRRRAAGPGLVRDALQGATAVGPIARTAYRRYARGLPAGSRPSHVWLQVWLEQVPDPDSRVRLGTARDAHGLRRASVTWRCSDAEVRTSRALTSWVGEDLERLGVGRLAELPVMHDDAAWRTEVRDAYHPAGTTRMSDGPGTGVVDPTLQVHGLPGLYAVGSSVFPTAGYANPTLTIVALAFRLAGHLAHTDVAAAR